MRTRTHGVGVRENSLARFSPELIICRHANVTTCGTDMNGLNLPTDNLYKFIALAGLTLIFFSLYFIFTRLEQGTALRNQLEIDSASINAESERIEFEWEMLKQKV